MCARTAGYQEGLLSQVPFDVVLDGGPTVIGPFNWIEATEKGLFFVEQELDQDITLPVAVENHLEIHGKRNVERCEPV